MPFYAPGMMGQQGQQQGGVNFQSLQPIQSGQVIANLPEQQSSGGGIGGIFKALSGIVGGISKASAPAATSSSAGGYSNPNTSGTTAPIAGLQGQQPGGFKSPQSALPGNINGSSNPYMNLAGQYLGTTEGQGAKTLSGFFQKSLGQNIDPKNTPWCGAFVGSVLASNGQQAPKNPLSARSYMNFGQATTTPSIGDVVVLSRGNDGVSGHVGFYNGPDKNGRPTMLAGNQGNSVSIQPYDQNRVLGYRTAPSAQEIQSKPSPAVMTQQATTRAQQDPQYARKITQEMNMVNPATLNTTQRISNMAQRHQQSYNLKDPHTDLQSTMDGIAWVETRGSKSAYTDRGMTVTSGQYKGEQAAGKYQIMPGNIPSWSKAATGKAYTTEEFLASPDIQDRTAAYMINQNLNKYGNAHDAASAWLTGGPVKRAQKSGARDGYGTGVNEYLQVFDQGVTNAQGGQQSSIGPQSMNGDQSVPNQQQEEQNSFRREDGRNFPSNMPTVDRQVTGAPPQANMQVAGNGINWGGLSSIWQKPEQRQG